jgi:endonuclease/exonuclease/phosphatase (EEP) superfamily protein YafD
MSRRRTALAWIAVAGMAVSAVSPWVERVVWRWATAVRALMPWSALSAGPVAAGALVTRRWRLAATSAGVALAGAGMAAPLIRRRPQPAADAAAHRLKVIHSNLLYINRRVPDVPATLARYDADVVTFSELTPSHAAHLRRSSLAATYPYRVELPARYASGTGLWSRFPLTERVSTNTKHHTVVVDIDLPGGPVRVIVLHTQSPFTHHGQWEHDLRQLATLTVDHPALMTGDFNASWWHPEFRRLLEHGWRDAHIESGRGLKCSWPTDRWHPVFHLHPPFVRLDHALVNDGLAVLDVDDFDVPGSDHLGLVVTVQRAAPATP